MAERSTTLFKRLLESHDVLAIPGGFSPYLARMCEQLGYQAFFMSGSQVAAYVYGLPDIGLISMRDMVDQARRLASGSNIPIFADADTGYGNALNVRYTVQEYVRAGVAGLHIEDQEAPKKSGTQAGRRCISVDEAIGKFKAAVAAKNELDADFVVCARCDLIGAENGTFEAAVERCIAYVEEARVDAIWLNTVQSREEVREACRRIPGPVIPLYGGPSPSPTLEEWQELGAAAVLYPALTTSVGLQATWEFLNDFKQRDVAAQRDWAERARSSPAGPVDREGLLALSPDEIRELEAQLLPRELQRDYDHTFGHGV